MRTQQKLRIFVVAGLYNHIVSCEWKTFDAVTKCCFSPNFLWVQNGTLEHQTIAKSPMLPWLFSVLYTQTYAYSTHEHFIFLANICRIRQFDDKELKITFTYSDSAGNLYSVSFSLYLPSSQLPCYSPYVLIMGNLV